MFCILKYSEFIYSKEDKYLMTILLLNQDYDYDYMRKQMKLISGSKIISCSD